MELGFIQSTDIWQVEERIRFYYITQYLVWTLATGVSSSKQQDKATCHISIILCQV